MANRRRHRLPPTPHGPRRLRRRLLCQRDNPHALGQTPRPLANAGTGVCAMARCAPCPARPRRRQTMLGRSNTPSGPTPTTAPAPTGPRRAFLSGTARSLTLAVLVALPTTALLTACG